METKEETIRKKENERERQQQQQQARQRHSMGSERNLDFAIWRVTYSRVTIYVVL